MYQLMTEYAYAKDIRIYGGEGLISRKYMENAEAQMKKKEKLGRGNAGAASIAYLFYALQLLCMLITFSYMVYRKDISIAEYTVLLSSAMLFVSIITGFFENLAEIRELCKYTKLCEEYDTLLPITVKSSMAELLLRSRRVNCGRTDLFPLILNM